MISELSTVDLEKLIEKGKKAEKLKALLSEITELSSELGVKKSSSEVPTFTSPSTSLEYSKYSIEGREVIRLKRKKGDTPSLLNPPNIGAVFISPENTIYITPNVSRFEREMKVSRNHFAMLRNGEATSGETRGWRLPNEGEYRLVRSLLSYQNDVVE